GRERGLMIEPAGVEPLEPGLQIVAWLDSTAAEATDLGQRPVQLDHLAAAGGVVESIDVLGDQTRDHAGLLEGRERAMSQVGPGRTKARPADHRPRPVAGPRGGVVDVGGEADRVAGASAGALAAIVGDPRLG